MCTLVGAMCPYGYMRDMQDLSIPCFLLKQHFERPEERRLSYAVFVLITYSRRDSGTPTVYYHRMAGKREDSTY